MMNYEKINNTWDTFNSMLQGAFSRDMKTDIMETEDGYTLEVEVPGVSKENIGISYQEDTLTIEVKKMVTDKKVNYIAKERFSQNMTRSYYLIDADEDNITAKLENGILTVTIAKIVAKSNGKKNIVIE